MYGAENKSASMRSSMPPWPGKSAPESLTPTERLSIDSHRSPIWQSALAGIATSTQSTHDSDGRYHSLASASAPNDPRSPPSPPMTVFFGLTDSYSFFGHAGPMKRPAKYAVVSENQVQVSVMKTHAPPSGP